MIIDNKFYDTLSYILLSHFFNSIMVRAYFK